MVLNRGEEHDEIMAQLVSGECVGEMALLGQPERTASVWALEDAMLLKVSTRVLDAALEEIPELAGLFNRITWTRLLQENLRTMGLFSNLAPQHLAKLGREVQWRYLSRGEYLFRQNDDARDGMYVLVQGSLHVVSETEGKPRATGRLNRGAVVGEMSLVTGEARSVSVRAFRDCELLQISRRGFDTVIAQDPSALLHMLRTEVARLKDATHRRHTEEPASIIAFIPITAGVPTDSCVEAIVKTLSAAGPLEILTGERVDRELGRRLARVPESDPRSSLIDHLLARVESAADLTVYPGDSEMTPWIRRCVNHADRIVLLAHSDEAIPPPEQIAIFRPEELELPCDLVLLHQTSARRPQRTLRWIEAVRPSRHHHVAMDRAEDFGRVGRVLSGQAVGLVFGGGGARGAAHPGVVLALREAGISIDFAGGASAGSLAGACVAEGFTPEESLRAYKIAFVESKAGKVFDIPFHSLFSSAGTEKALAEIFPGRQIEDLWLSFFCVASNLTNPGLKVYRQGELATAVRTSGAYPGLVPPVPDSGEVMVDGGLFNNLPVDIMQGVCPGPTIAVTLSTFSDLSVPAEVSRTPTGWEALRSRLTRQKRVEFPRLSAIVARAVEAASMRLQVEMSKRADLCIAPPVKSFGLTDFAKAGLMFEVGYKHTRSVLEELEKTSPALLRLLTTGRRQNGPSSAG